MTSLPVSVDHVMPVSHLRVVLRDSLVLAGFNCPLVKHLVWEKRILPDVSCVEAVCSDWCVLPLEERLHVLQICARIGIIPNAYCVHELTKQFSGDSRLVQFLSIGFGFRECTGGCLDGGCAEMRPLPPLPPAPPETDLVVGLTSEAIRLDALELFIRCTERLSNEELQYHLINALSQHGLETCRIARWLIYEREIKPRQKIMCELCWTSNVSDEVMLRIFQIIMQECQDSPGEECMKYACGRKTRRVAEYLVITFGYRFDHAHLQFACTWQRLDVIRFIFSTGHLSPTHVAMSDSEIATVLVSEDITSITELTPSWDTECPLVDFLLKWTEPTQEDLTKALRDVCTVNNLDLARRLVARGAKADDECIRKAIEYEEFNIAEWLMMDIRLVPSTEIVNFISRRMSRMDEAPCEEWLRLVRFAVEELGAKADAYTVWYAFNSGCDAASRFALSLGGPIPSIVLADVLGTDYRRPELVQLIKERSYPPLQTYQDLSFGTLVRMLVLAIHHDGVNELEAILTGTTRGLGLFRDFDTSEHDDSLEESGDEDDPHVSVVVVKTRSIPRFDPEPEPFPGCWGKHKTADTILADPSVRSPQWEALRALAGIDDENPLMAGPFYSSYINRMVKVSVSASWKTLELLILGGGGPRTREEHEAILPFHGLFSSTVPSLKPCRVMILREILFYNHHRASEIVSSFYTRMSPNQRSLPAVETFHLGHEKVRALVSWIQRNSVLPDTFTDVIADYLVAK